ncbi:MAG: phosphoesterase [Deltaproteobacteria bacterium]|nr:phosphoesterase [Deltaproteobacteria bacterium]
MPRDTEHKDEYVLVIPTRILWQIGYFEGLNFDTQEYLRILEDSKNTEFRRRSIVETDYQYKQLIPYIILSHDNTIFSYRRGKLLNEKRLAGNYSIGLGGHVSVNDVDLFEVSYHEAMLRELTEEVEIRTNYTQTIVAMLNDDSNDVGRVHIGIIYFFDLKYPAVFPKEKSINEPEFISIPSLIKNVERYESWSKICIENIDKIIKHR